MTKQPGERIGYDELLESRVKQLREIHEQLRAIESGTTDAKTLREIMRLRNNIADMIRAAEAESAAF